MLEAIAFKTRARTIDHLGREQIADCPTAVSELWKNAYDAYASEVALHVFDGQVPIAAVFDDGHGMSRDEFEGKWLVVGTESKATESEVPEEDRNGLPYRPKQGQKGIGRLSSANLGSLLLLISKRHSDPYAAALIDWRLFENPFVYLHDIEIPLVEFSAKEDLWVHLPALFDKLMGNVWGDGIDRGRDERLASAWTTYDALEKSEGRASTKQAIEETLIETTFTQRHLENWSVWSGARPNGTAMLMAGISYDLEAQLRSPLNSTESETDKVAHEKLFQTLSNFTDPFVDSSEENSEFDAVNFRYSVTAWEGALSRPVISDRREFGYQNLEELEHVLEGEIDRSGIFRGTVKAFGERLAGTITINPPYSVPTRSDAVVGSFHLRIGTFEQLLMNTTHSSEIHSKLAEQADKYGGFLVFRNGLRVMPYGREDNDFFEIEKRRSHSFGREFWSYRRLFGRVALTRQCNPNLRDKAGREGIIDNKAAKIFRDVVINIFKESARRFFGSDSDVRNKRLPELQNNYSRQKAEEAQKKIRSRKLKEFRRHLESSLSEIQQLESELTRLATSAQDEILPTTETELLALRQRISELKTQKSDLALGPPPNSLGALESDYREFRRADTRASELIIRLADSISHALDKVKPKSSRDKAYSELNRHAAHLQNRLRKWSAEAKDILGKEVSRISDIVENRNRLYHTKTLPLLDDLEHARTSLTRALDQLETEREKQDRENAEVFEPYISTLKSLQESVDIETLVTFTMEESSELRADLDRLNALAQLGITVEIIGHEIEGLDMTISRALDQFPESVKSGDTFKTIQTAHHALVDRLRFLSPLKLSGEKIRSWITGKDIVEYVQRFLSEPLKHNRIDLQASAEFERFSVFEQASRIYPVFINLVNNSIYWVGQSTTSSRKILLDVADGRVVVADDGPGVAPEFLKSLFTLFFTRKARSGRGVGLYLCRANLAASGHTIAYATDSRLRRLSGANFVIDFKGAKHG